MEEEIITFKATKDFREHLDNQAIKKKISRSAYIKAVLKKFGNYKVPKEKEIV